MGNRLKRGQALRGTRTLTPLVFGVSQLRLQAHPSGDSKDQGTPATGAQVTEMTLSYPLSKDWGAAKRGRGKESNTPPPAFRSRLPYGTRETSCRMSKRVGRRERRPPRNAKARTQSRLEHRSLRTGKPWTPGWELTAKASSL